MNKKEKKIAAIEDKAQNAKDIVESNVPKHKKDKSIDNLISKCISYSNSYGEDDLKIVLTSIGFTSYETDVFLNTTKGSVDHDLIHKFLQNTDLNSTEYKSPLDQNLNWLSSSIIKKDELSEKFGSLIEYVIKDFKPNQRAEFLAIFDQYISSISQQEDKHWRIEKFQNFNPESYNSGLVKILIEDLNKFVKRYSVDDQGVATRVNFQDDPIFGINHKNQIVFQRGSTRQTDAVFDDIDGNIGLICVTSMSSTDQQHQIFKFVKSLKERYPNKEINTYLYSDSMLKENSQKTNKRGRPSKSSLPQIQSLNSEEITSLNIVSAMQVFMMSDVADKESFIYCLERARYQFFNHDGGVKIKNMDAKQKIWMLQKSLNTGFDLICKDKSFWLSQGIAKDIQKQILGCVCRSFNWLHHEGLVDDQNLIKNATNVLEGLQFDSNVNLSGIEREGYVTTKRILGIKTNTIFG